MNKFAYILFVIFVCYFCLFFSYNNEYMSLNHFLIDIHTRCSVVRIVLIYYSKFLGDLKSIDVN